MSADPIRARLDELQSGGRGHQWLPYDALRAVLDLCDQHAVCPAGFDCTRGINCASIDIRRAIADALGVTP